MADFRREMTSNFQGQIWNLLYLNQKWSDCHGTKIKHIGWNLGLKCDHRLWPWLWSWPWIFNVKYGICYIAANIVRLPRNEKQYRLNSRPQTWPSGLTLSMTLTLNFQIYNLLYLSQKWPDCRDTKKQAYQLNSMPQMWPWPLTTHMALTMDSRYLRMGGPIDIEQRRWK